MMVDGGARYMHPSICNRSVTYISSWNAMGPGEYIQALPVWFHVSIILYIEPLVMHAPCLTPAADLERLSAFIYTASCSTCINHGNVDNCLSVCTYFANIK